MVSHLGMEFGWSFGARHFAEQICDDEVQSSPQ